MLARRRKDFSVRSSNMGIPEKRDRKNFRFRCGFTCPSCFLPGLQGLGSRMVRGLEGTRIRFHCPNGMVRAFATLLLIGSAPIAVLAAQAPLHGRVEGGIYTSPTGAFSIPVPVLPELGGMVSDTANVVTFEDQFSRHLSIAVFSLNAVQRRDLQALGTKDFLVRFFESYVLPDFLRQFPGTQVEQAIFLPTLHEGSLIAHTLLPGGSMFALRGLLPEQRLVAKRGNLLFVKNRHVFVVSTELAERVLEHATYDKTPEEENAVLRERLLEYVGRLTFPEPTSPR